MTVIKKGVFITFSVRTDKLDSDSERTKFFKTLYGWEQVVPKGNKEYVYHREGILEKVPHEKVNQSSFIVPENGLDEIFQFFQEWSNKVMMRTFKVFLDEEMQKHFREFATEDEEEEEEI